MTVVLLLLAHWVGDFAFQTSPMALNKSHSLKWLTIHTVVYSASILAFCIFLMPLDQVWIYVGVNFTLHFVTDFFTSKWAYMHRKTPRKFYPIIGLDQLLHTSALYLTLDLLEINMLLN